MLSPFGSPAELRELPRDLGVEQFLIGSVLMSNHFYARVSDLVNGEHFFEPFHRKVWETIAHRIESGHIATAKTIKHLLGQEEISGQPVQAYLAHLLAEGGGTVASIVEHARILHDLFVRRSLIGLAHELADKCFSPDVTLHVSEIVNTHEEDMTALRPKISPSDKEFSTFDDAAFEAVRSASDAYAFDERVIGVPTGLHNLDSAIGGLQKSDLVVVAGRPGMGKTALATNIAFNVARHIHAREGHRGSVAFFSLEMSKVQVANRILAEQSRVEGWRVRRGKVSQAELEEYIVGAEALRNLPLLIDDRPRPTITQLAARARTLQKRFGVDLIVVDYLQLMRGAADTRQVNRVQEVSEITASLKSLAKELECPVLALSQLSRNIEARDDKRPQLADLRESGSIEQDADAVLMIYRAGYYLERAEPRAGTQKHYEWEADMEQAAGRADVIVAKNRHGPLNTVALGWDATITQFHNDVPEAPEKPAKAEREAKAKAANLSKDGSQAFVLLRGMLVRCSLPTPEQIAQGVPAGARLIPVDLARADYGKAYIDGVEDKKLRTEFTKVCKELHRAGKIKWSGPEGARFIWLPEHVANA